MLEVVATNRGFRIVIPPRPPGRYAEDNHGERGEREGCGGQWLGEKLLHRKEYNKT